MASARDPFLVAVAPASDVKYMAFHGFSSEMGKNDRMEFMPVFPVESHAGRGIIQSKDSHSPEVIATMFKLRILVFPIMALAMGGTLLTLSGCGGTAGGGSTKPAPPTIGVVFGATTIPLNGSTSLTFNLSNPNTGVTLTGIGFTDSLPAGLVVSTPNGLTGSCDGGTITASAGSGSVSLSSAALAASAACSFSVNVTGISSGPQNNATSAVTSNEGGNGNAASASITVSASPAPPTIGKAFGAATIALNGSTALTFNLSNPNAGVTLTGVGFTDALPAGLLVSTPNGLTGSCGGGTISASAGSGSVSLSSAALAASATCSFAVNVTGTSSGPQNNATTAVTSNEGGNGNAASASVTVSGKIQHVVLIIQENRSTDNMFQDPVLIGRGADIAQSGLDSNGNTIPLQELDIAAAFNPAHGHHAFNVMCDLNSVTGQCQMDGANLISVTCPQGVQNCVYSYVNPSELQPYFQMAETYTFADHMFQTNQGPSMPAHQFLISGTSAPSTGSNLFAAENPNTNGAPNAGCDAPTGSTVTLIDPTGSEDSKTPIYPCFEHPTLTDLLEANGNTWRYYTSSGYGYGQGLAIWIGPEAIQHICEPLVNG
ncbi:MAG: alkaline phosphatase family protein, partial [Terriglobales bacterium]